MPQQDFRARLRPKSTTTKNQNGVQVNDVLGENNPSNILYPLWQTNGVLFPYTPSVSTGNAAEYDQTSIVHTIYGYNNYVKSYPKPINIDAEFTAQTTAEALYMLAVIWFFRSVTKSYFGISPYDKAGTPPPVLLFKYLGDYQFNNIPVVVKTFDYSYPADIDYVPVNTTIYSNYLKGVQLPPGTLDGFTYVPTHLKVHIELDTQYTPIELRNQFNLDDFRQGRLINKGYI